MNTLDRLPVHHSISSLLVRGRKPEFPTENPTDMGGAPQGNGRPSWESNPGPSHCNQILIEPLFLTLFFFFYVFFKKSVCDCVLGMVVGVVALSALRP